MLAIVAALSLLLTSPLPKEREPDCQRFCLGVCSYDRKMKRCQDSRVEYIGTWDPIPTDYSPSSQSEFPIWNISNPKDWPEYPTELRPEPPPEPPVPTPPPADTCE